MSFTFSKPQDTRIIPNEKLCFMRSNGEFWKDFDFVQTDYAFFVADFGRQMTVWLAIKGQTRTELFGNIDMKKRSF